MWFEFHIIGGRWHLCVCGGCAPHSVGELYYVPEGEGVSVPLQFDASESEIKNSARNMVSYLLFVSEVKREVSE